MSEDTNTPNPSFEDDFSDMESTLDSLPTGSFITLSHEANPPMYVALVEGENSITIRVAADRRGLTLGASVQAYVDGGIVNLDTPVVAGTVVTLVGNVKGG